MSTPGRQPIPRANRPRAESVRATSKAAGSAAEQTDLAGLVNYLQRTVGNHAVSQMIQQGTLGNPRRPTPSPRSAGSPTPAHAVSPRRSPDDALTEDAEDQDALEDVSSTGAEFGVSGAPGAPPRSPGDARASETSSPEDTRVRPADGDAPAVLQRQAAGAATDTSGKKSLLNPSGHELPRMSAEPNNPTYYDALIYVTQWADEQHSVGMNLIHMKEKGFEAFSKLTSSEYNRKESGLLELFEAVLSLVPGAGVLVKTLKLFQEGSRLVKATEAIGRLAKSLPEKAEDTQKVIETGKAAVTLAGSLGGGRGSSGDAKLDFELRVLRELSDLENDLVSQVYTASEYVTGRLKVFKHVHAGIDLEAEVKKILGEKPPVSTSNAVMDQVRDQFMHELIKRFYFDLGRYRRVIHQEYRPNNPLAIANPMNYFRAKLPPGKWVATDVEHRGIPGTVVNYIDDKKLWAFMARDEPVKVTLIRGTQVTELPMPGILLARLPVHATGVP